MFRSMEQNWESRNKPHMYGQLLPTEVSRWFNWERTVISKNHAGISRCPYVPHIRKLTQNG